MAVAKGIIPAKRMTLSQLIVRYASLTVLKQPPKTIRTAAISTAITGGNQLKTMANTINIKTTAA
jgi:hypothetical protein